MSTHVVAEEDWQTAWDVSFNAGHDDGEDGLSPQPQAWPVPDAYNEGYARGVDSYNERNIA